MSAPIARGDLELVLDEAGDDLRALEGARLFMTGGTGFVGTWLVETYAAAWEKLRLGGSITVLSRDPSAFADRLPHLGTHPAVRLVRGDVRSPPPKLGPFDAVIHAATPASAQVNDETPELMVATIVDGMRAVLALAAESGSIPFLFTSSGAVYGQQPPDLAMLEEGHTGSPDPLDARNAYHEAKRLAELLGSIAHERDGVEFKVARLFAFVGPHLPIDRHFAIGNFLGDALAGRPIVVQGDGRPLRSYLYAADLAVWLWRILLRAPACRAYNVGSEVAVSIAETAQAVACVAGGASAVEIRRTPSVGPPPRYVPSTERARTELGLVQRVGLAEAVRRTLAWHRSSTGLPTEAAT